MEKAIEKTKEFGNWLFGPGLGALVLALIAAIIGMTLLWLAPILGTWLGTQSVVSPIQDVAKVFVATVVIQLITKTWLWKSTLDTFYEKLQLRDAVIGSGFNNFYWFDDIPWRELFKQSHEVLIVAISANSLLTSSFVGVIRDFLAKPNTKLTIILANPIDDDLMKSYDKQFGQREGTRKERVISSLKEILQIAQETKSSERVRLCYTSNLPKYSYYRFDNSYFFLPYLTKRERGPQRIPALVFRDGPFADTFLNYDINYILATSTTCQGNEQWLIN